VTDYEELLLKFCEFFDIAEYKRCETTLKQGSMSFAARFNFFTFDYGVICLLQGQFKKAAELFEQVIG